MIISKFILIGKEMILCHSPIAKFMPPLIEIAIPCSSAILNSVTYQFKVEKKKQIGFSMKVNFMSLANTWHITYYSWHHKVISCSCNKTKTVFNKETFIWHHACLMSWNSRQQYTCRSKWLNNGQPIIIGAHL